MKRMWDSSKKAIPFLFAPSAQLLKQNLFGSKKSVKQVAPIGSLEQTI